MKKVLFLLTIITSVIILSCCKKPEDDVIVKLNCTTTSTNVTTYGGNDGTITVSVSTGNPPYEFTLAPTNTKNSTGSFTSLVAGSYTVSVKDSKNETDSKAVTLTQPNPPIPVLTATTTVVNVVIFGGTTGKITVSAKGGVKPYTYNLDGGTFQTDSVFNNLSAKPYTIVVKDANTPNTSITLPVITLTQPIPTALTATTKSVNVTTYGGSDGKITVSAKGGVKPYTYNLDGGTFQTDSVFNNLSAKPYTIVVKDANTPNTSITLPVITLTQPIPTALTATTKSVNVTCNGSNNGSITVTVTSGTTPYTYSKDGVNFQSSNVFSGLTANTYTIIVKDANLTLTLPTVTITQPTVISGTPTVVDASFGNSDGKITITANGGTSTLTYSKDGINFQSSNVFSGLSPNNYTITVKDVNGCTLVIPNITVSQSPLKVGDTYLGGTVASVDGNGHGFVVYGTDYTANTWGIAYNTTKGLTVGGTGWRLPTNSELVTLWTSATTYGMVGSYWSYSVWGDGADGSSDTNGTHNVHYYYTGVTTFGHDVLAGPHKYKAVKSF